jgi:hypothetical protein
VSETWRQIWIVLHLVSSGTWILVFFGHLRGQIKNRLRSRQQEG